MTKLVCGAGFNDKTRPANVDGKDVKEYGLWRSMLERCFSENIKHAIQPIKVVMFLITFLITLSSMTGVKNKLGLERLMKKEEVGVWIKTCYLSATKHILKPLVFLYRIR